MAFPPSLLCNRPKNSGSWGLGEAPPLLGVGWGGCFRSRRRQTPGFELLAWRSSVVPGPAGWQLCPRPRESPGFPRLGKHPSPRDGEDSGNLLGQSETVERAGGGDWTRLRKGAKDSGTSAHSPSFGDPQVSRTAWENYARNSAREGRGGGPGSPSDRCHGLQEVKH